MRKKFVRKWSSNNQNLKKILRKSLGSISKIKCFIDQKLIFHHNCIQNVKDGIQIQVYNVRNECLTHFSHQFISEKVKKNITKSQAQFREKLRKLRLRQNYSFLITKTCMLTNSEVLRSRKTLSVVSSIAVKDTKVDEDILHFKTWVFHFQCLQQLLLCDY